MRDASTGSLGDLRSAVSKAAIAFSGSSTAMYASPSIMYEATVGFAAATSSWHAAYARLSLRCSR